MYYITFDNDDIIKFNKDNIPNLPYENINELALSFCELDNYDFIKKCIKLKTLNLNNNNLNNLDKDLFKYNTQLKFLLLHDNNLTNLDKNLFKDLILLEFLYLSNNNLTNLDKDLFKYNIQLQELNLSWNKLTNLDKDLFKYNTQLQILILNNNKLINLDRDLFTYNTQLKTLILSNNNLTLLPKSIINLNRLEILRYQNNEIEYIPPNLQRFLNRLNQIDNNLQIYNDNQNVHNHSIQEGIKSSLENILNIPKTINKDKLIQNIINSNISEKSIRLLLEYCQDTSIHTVLEINFEEALLHILEFINLQCSEHKDEIYSIIDTEIQDSECKCFTGRISRLINCLNGFTDKVQVTIPDNMAISNIIVMLKQNYSGDNEEELKEEVKKALLERGYDEQIINTYIEFVELD
jgi:hypothetical protein